MKLFLGTAAAFAVVADSAKIAVNDAAILGAEYEAYLKKYGRDKDKMSASMYAARLKIFAKSRADVATHNARSDVSWKVGINQFSDRTPEEKKEVLGYKRSGKPQTGSLLAVEVNHTAAKSTKVVAESIDFRNLKTASLIRDQGACGSCWAVAAASTIEMRAEIQHKIDIPQLSYGQLRDCTPNPRNCGGAGGCKGATAELGLNYAMEHGLASEADYATHIKDSTCLENVAPTVKVERWVTLPVNKLAPLQEAMNDGPVALSIDASGIHSYSSGVFAGCESKDATISHAVTGVGYGKDAESGKKYWLIRNSWGENWGENGYFRLLKHDHDEGDAGYCGTDYEPKQGVGCDGGPPTLPVCGMCGILSDSAVPIGVKMLKGPKAALSQESELGADEEELDASDEEEAELGAEAEKQDPSDEATEEMSELGAETEEQDPLEEAME